MGLLDFFGVRRYFGLDQPVSKVKHPFSSGAQQYGESAAWNYYNQQTTRPAERATRYRNYERMDQYELIASALDLYVEETFVYDLEHDASIWVDSPNADIVRIGKQLFDRVGMEERGPGIIREMVKFGDRFDALSHNSETGDIINMQSPPPINIARIQEHGKLLGFKPNIQGNKSKAANKKDGGVKWRPWEIVHFRMPSRGRDDLYGDSILFPAASAWEQLKMVEDSLVVYRMTKAADRIIYYVDVGNATPEEAYDIVNRWRKSIKKREHLNKGAGNYSTQWNPQCFSGNTKVMLADGGSITFDEWVKTPNEEKWVLSKDSEGNTVPGLGYHPRCSGEKETCYVTLDNGSKQECTFDHPWMLKDGSYKKAIELEEGDSLAATYTKISSKDDGDTLNGYEQVWDDNSGGWRYVHQLVVHECLGGYRPGTVAHHKDFNKLNNCPSNLELMPHKEHFELHGVNYAEGLGKWVEENKEWTRENARRIGKVWGPINLTKYNKSAEHRTVASKTLRKTVTDLWENDPEYREKMRKAQVKNGKLHAEVYNKSDQSRAVGKKMSKQNFAVYRSWQKLPKDFKKENPFHEWKLTQKVPNHCVVSVVPSGRKIPVFDITVKEHHNFSIDVSTDVSSFRSGVYVHNSIDADLFWPVREGSQSRVDKLQGTPNISDIVDVEYQRNKVFGALRIPRGYMGFEDNSSGLSSETGLSSQSTRFASTIKAIRKAFLAGVRRLVAIQLVYKGIDPEDPKNSFKIGMSPISYLDELMRSKTYQLRMDMLQTAMNIGMQAPDVIDQTKWLKWGMRNFLRMSDDDVEMFLGNMPDVEGQGQATAADADKLVQLVQSNPESGKALMEAWLLGKISRESTTTYPDNWAHNPLPPLKD